jgi:serine/threonine protein kinase
MDSLAAKLVVVHEPFSGPSTAPREHLGGRTFALKRSGESKIGREASLVDIVLPAPTVSRVHARIVVDGESSTIENISRAGTQVHFARTCPGERTTPRSSWRRPCDEASLVRLEAGGRATLHDGDYVDIGGYSLRFQAAPCIPGYELLDELGRGGMGLVFKARRNDGCGVVAVKILRVGIEASPRARARFRIEAEALACVDHPNIVKIRDAGVHAGHPFFVIDYAENGSLHWRISGRPQDPAWAAAMARTLARAMEHAHRRSILHRDLKPANILLATDDTPWVSDFGLVKFELTIKDITNYYRSFSMPDYRLFVIDPDSQASGGTDDTVGEEVERSSWMARDFAGETGPFGNDGRPRTVLEFLTGSDGTDRPWGDFDPSRPLMLTEAGAIMGSPQYMAPEQAQADAGAIGPRTDVYGLGGILYEMLTGVPAFTYSNGNLAALLMRICTEAPEPPSRLQPSIPPQIEAICLKCLEKKPEHRYESAGALAEDLDHYLQGRPPGIPVAQPLEPGPRRDATTLLMGNATTRSFLP